VVELALGTKAETQFNTVTQTETLFHTTGPPPLPPTPHTRVRMHRPTSHVHSVEPLSNPTLRVCLQVPTSVMWSWRSCRQSSSSSCSSTMQGRKGIQTQGRRVLTGQQWVAGACMRSRIFGGSKWRHARMCRCI
jgi:hypothetical protein